MVTKWKNLIKKVTEYIPDAERTVLALFSTTIGLYMLYSSLDRISEGWLAEKFLFLFGNIGIAYGVMILLREVWKRKYKDWETMGEELYTKWKTLCINWEKFFLITAVSLLVILVFLIRNALGHMWEWDAFYFAFLIQIAVFQVNLLCLMKDKLEIVMVQIEGNNSKRVAEALAIEKQSLEKASRSDKLRVELITNVSHDLKTPLTSIVGYLELIKKEELSDVVHDYVDVIAERVEKLKEMIGSLFSLAKASSGNVEFHIEKFEVNRLLEQILADMKDKIDESTLEVVTQFTEGNTELTTDNMYFYRICQNLIENALKYSAKGTRVFIKTYVKEGNKLCLEITNTAGYLMDFKKEDILERFARADQARNTEGNGLGLAIVSTYANALGGVFDIQVECDQFKAWLMFPSN